MKAKWLSFMTIAIGLFYATPLFAASAPAAAQSNPKDWAVPLAAALSIGIAAGLCGIGQGKAGAAACEGLARNPGARPGLFLFWILSLVFIETLAIYTLIVSLILIFKK